MKQTIESAAKRREDNLAFVRQLNLMSDVGEEIKGRVRTFCNSLKFPAEPVLIRFEIQQLETELHLRFYVNGNKEDFMFPVGPGCKQWKWLSDGIVDSVRVLPWRLLVTAFRTMGEDVAAENDDDDLPHILVLLPASRGRHNLTHLRSFYRYVHPAWQHGNAVYKSNCNFPNWRETVKGEIKGPLLAQSARMGDLVPEPNIFDELVGRFKKPDKSDEVIEWQEKLKDRRMPATAEELALDHAAHLCGVELYEYSIRHLKQLKSDRPSKRN